ncbi:MAG: T9SS type A sorting domain-containing protein [Saprospiraceae bacterium]
MKRILTALFLVLSFCGVSAQSICDSVLVIDPIPDICAAPNEFVQLTATPPGGVFSGPNISSDGWLNASNLSAGTYTANYTITTDTCAVNAARDFIVLPSPSAFAFSIGTIDCNNPNGTTIDLVGDYNGNGISYWVTNDFTFFSADLNTTTDKAGLYYFIVEDPQSFSCNTIIPVEVDQVGAQPVVVTSCSDCTGLGPLLIGVNFDETVPRQWTNLTTGLTVGSTPCLYPQQAGLWQVSVQDPVTGCISTNAAFIPSPQGSIPSVNAGSTAPVPCSGFSGQLLGAYNESAWDFEILWTTTDGNLTGGINTLTPTFTSPGTYHLTVTNPFTGCSDTDFVTVGVAPITEFLSLTLCAGSTIMGSDTSGTYIDTLVSSGGCDSIIVIDAIFLEETVYNEALIADSGAGDGAIILDVAGAGPFTYTWSNGTTSTTSVLSNLSAGSYTVTITNSNGCQSIFSFEILLDPVNGGATAQVNGQVFFDENNNCVLDPGEQGLGNIHVSIGNAQQEFAQNADFQGWYSFPLSAGNYGLSATPSSPLWKTCTDTVLLPVLNPFDTVTVNYPMQAVVSSPILQVEVAMNSLRRCFENTLTIHYENLGTATATDAYVEVLFDPRLDIISSTNPWTMVDGTLYTFELGDIAVNESGSFSLVVIPNCQTTSLGEIVCVEAHIYPDSIPSLSNLAWDGPLITVDGECVDGELNFSIKNIGIGDMLSPNTYIVIEDAILNATDNFQLNSGMEEIVNIQGNGATFWLRAEQADGAPFNPFPGYAIEGCAADTTMAFSLGFLNAFSFNDLGYATDGSCRPLIGSYDPNQKLAFPEGFTEEHYLERGVPIEYMIEFQNTGTDTAFTVELVDVLSDDLDLSTFEMIASSHAYQYRIQPDNELRFRFEQILLPDSTTNLALSQGYVKFKIAPKENLAAGTRIENQAAIYFDFNDPIITNETFHTIWEETIFEFFTSTSNLRAPEVALTIFPNPFTHSATVVIGGVKGNDFQFVLYDILGKQLYQQRSSQTRFEIQPKGLAPGTYFFELRDRQGRIGEGKLMVK